jgi:hypothetical protein
MRDTVNGLCAWTQAFVANSLTIRLKSAELHPHDAAAAWAK